MATMTIEALNHYYGQSHTLRDVAFEIAPAQCTCLMGRNGVGKTTLAKCLMGLEQPRSGSIRYNGMSFEKLPAESRAPNHIAYVPQGRQIFPLLSVEENIRTGFFSSSTKSYKIPSTIYDLFPVLADMRRRRGGDLSGGQQQQLAIARALVIEPQLLILDEPTEGIQPSLVQEISEVIKMLSQELKIAVLLVEQKLPFIHKVADSFVIMDRGSVAAKGEMQLLKDDLINQYLIV